MCIKKKFILIIILFILIFLPACNNVSRDFRIEKIQNMKIPRAGHTAITLNDGRVLILGYDTMGRFYNKPRNAEIYYPETKSFSLISKTKYLFSHSTALKMLDGKILLIGKDSAHVEIFDPKQLEFNEIKNINHIFTNPIMIKNDHLLSSNGHIVEIYDTKNNKILKITNLIKPRKDFRVILLNDETVLFMGGSCLNGNGYIKEVESYNLKTNKSKIVGQLLNPNNSNICLLMKNGKIFITNEGDKAEIYDTVTNTSQIIKNIYKNDKHAQLKGIMLQDNRILLYGSNIVLFDPKNNQFDLIKNNKNFRTDYQLTLLNNGDVLVTGGYDSEWYVELSETGQYNTAELVKFKKK